jgi:AbrB family looped-hinge helix DNA binding protein
MTTSNVTTKGQVTIPKKIRDKMHLKTGDKIDFVLEKDGTARILPVSSPIDSIIGIIKTRKKLTAAQMNYVISKRSKADKP